MASLYRQRKSPYWWIKFRDPTTRLIRRESTGYRIGVGPDYRAAQELRAQKSLAEKQSCPNLGAWDSWVPAMLANRINPRTAERYRHAWNALRLWLKQLNVEYPRQVTYAIASSYVAWRLSNPDKARGKYSVNRNTAALEFIIFRSVLSEAVRRGFCPANPAREVQLQHSQRRLYPDLTDAQLHDIYGAICSEREPWRTRLLRGFAVSLLHGVRLNETNPNPQTQLALQTDPPTVTFFQKGGRQRTKPLHPDLLPLFAHLHAAGATQTYPLHSYPNRLAWSNRWSIFFRTHGFDRTIPGVTFHSLRVTVENTLREAGIEQRVREAYLSHEHPGQMNARYDRVKLRELVACHAPLHRPWLVIPIATGCALPNPPGPTPPLPEALPVADPAASPVSSGSRKTADAPAASGEHPTGRSNDFAPPSRA